MDAFVISSLPSRLKETFQTEGPLCSAGVTPLHRSYGPIRHPLAFDRFPGFSRLYDLPCSGDFAPGRGELRQLLGVSLSPCCRFHPAEVTVPHRSDFGTLCCLRPTEAGSAFGSTLFRGHIRVHCRYGPVARNLPTGDLVDRLQDLGFPPPCYPNYGAPDYCPGRSVSC